MRLWAAACLAAGLWSFSARRPAGRRHSPCKSSPHLQKTGGAAAWIDADHTFDASHAATLGVMLEQLPIATPDSAEQALEIARQLCRSGAIDLLVVDSAAALVPKLELDAGIGVGGPGLHARVLASGLRTLSQTIARAESAVLMVNQIRNRMESSAGEAITSAGGPPLKLYSAVRIRLGPVTGKRVRFRVLKNKAGKGATDGEFEWNPGRGFTETP